MVSRAGARVVPLLGETNIAKVVSDPQPGFRHENQTIDTDDMTFGSLTFRPRTLAVIVKASREVLQDSLNIESALRRCLAEALALEFDKACMIGDGASAEPLGIANWEDINEVELNATPSYDAILDARTALLTNDSREPNALLLHPRDEGEYSKMKDGEGLPYPRPPAIEQMRFMTTTQLPTDLNGTESLMLTGDFRRALIGVRSELQIEVLKERYADDLAYGFLAFLRADLILEHDEAFAKITGVQSA